MINLEQNDNLVKIKKLSKGATLEELQCFLDVCEAEENAECVKYLKAEIAKINK